MSFESSFFLIFKMFYLSLRERASTSGRGSERGGDRGSEADSAPKALVLIAQSLMWGSNPLTERSWLELKSEAQPTEIPGHPEFWEFFIYSRYVFLSNICFANISFNVWLSFSLQYLLKNRSFYYYYYYLFERERERERMQAGERDRGGERES